MPPRQAPKVKVKAKQPIVDSDDDDISLSSDDNDDDEMVVAAPPPKPVTDERKKEFLRKFSQLMLDYNMNLSLEKLTGDQRDQLQKVINENASQSGKE